MSEHGQDILNIFVDEAGDPTLFANRRRAIVGTPGCSRFFILGKLEVDNPVGLAQRLTVLREQLLANPYFGGVPSFDPGRGKTAVAFHAKDDLPEVRYEVFKLLGAEGDTLRFFAVVCDKERILQDVLRRNETEPDYRYRHNELYDGLMRSLFGKFHRLADKYEVCVARRGQSDRTKRSASLLTMPNGILPRNSALGAADGMLGESASQRLKATLVCKQWTIFSGPCSVSSSLA